MLIKKLENCKEIIAGDKTVLRELLHPERDDIVAKHSIAYAIVKPGNSSAPHKLASTEIYYILNGQGKMHIDNEEENVTKNDAIYIPPNSIQYIENTGNSDLCFLCMVDPAWKPEDEEIIK